MIFPGRKRKILRNFHFILPKFHFILPKFYLPAPWRILFSSVGDLDFLRSFLARVASAPSDSSDTKCYS